MWYVMSFILSGQGGVGTGDVLQSIFSRNKTVMENDDRPPSRVFQDRTLSPDCLRVLSSLISFSRNCQSVSSPGLDPSPFVRGVPCPLFCFSVFIMNRSIES
jgi:hypothetical protein